MQKILKNERGSVALFVLLSVLFFLVVVTGVAVSFKNKETQIDSQFEKIKQSYEKELGNEGQVYNDALNKTVIFETCGGTVSPTSKIVRLGETYEELPIATKTGYTFKGWVGKNLFDEQTLLMAISGATYENGHYIFTTSNAYSKYGNKGGNGNHFPIYNFKENTQYTFSIYGYNTGEWSNNIWINYSYTDGTSNYLRFTLKEEGLFKFTSNQGKTISKISVSYNSSTTNYISHIQLEEGTEATEFEPYQIITPDTTVTNRKNHTLTAVMEAKQYTLTFNANGGTVSPTTKKIRYDLAYGTLPTPTRTGYTFDGWYTQEEGGDMVETTTKLNDLEDKTIYAHWSET